MIRACHIDGNEQWKDEDVNDRWSTADWNVWIQRGDWSRCEHGRIKTLSRQSDGLTWCFRLRPVHNVLRGTHPSQLSAQFASCVGPTVIVPTCDPLCGCRQNYACVDMYKAARFPDCLPDLWLDHTSVRDASLLPLPCHYVHSLCPRWTFVYRTYNGHFETYTHRTTRAKAIFFLLV